MVCHPTTTSSSRNLDQWDCLPHGISPGEVQSCHLLSMVTPFMAVATTYCFTSKRSAHWGSTLCGQRPEQAIQRPLRYLTTYLSSIKCAKADKHSYWCAHLSLFVIRVFVWIASSVSGANGKLPRLVRACVSAKE